MKTLRQWTLDPSEPYVIQLAADARISRTNYVDDQVWDVLTGSGDEPAIALHTKYGGRAGLVSLVPMWTHDGHLFYQAMTYASAPIITRFTPDMVVIQARILPDIALELTLRAMESQVIGGIVTLMNSGTQPARIRFDLFGHVGLEGREQKMQLIDLPGGGSALYLGNIVNLQPVVMIEKGNTESGSASRLGTNVSIKPGGKTSVRFVHAGLTDVNRSITLAQRWLRLDWKPFLDASVHTAGAIPAVETGSQAWDAVIASSYTRLMQSFLRPAGQFPRSTFVAARTSGDGFSRKGDGSDYPRSWSGQDPLLAYLITPAAAAIDAELAKAVIINYLATQSKKDGTIDYKPGPAGQRQEMLCLPLLARTTWNIVQQTDDDAFLKEVFPGLLKFFERWLSPDFDKDGDGFPEWQDERQTGFVAFPTFAPGQIWAQGLKISTVESPDLPAYLLSEARALHSMATRLKNKTALKQLAAPIKQLQEALASLWNGTHFTYRDRDTHSTPTGRVLLHDAAGNEEHFLAEILNPPSRLMVRITGGVNHVPRITLTVDGLSESGIKITEKADSADFLWHHRQGLYTTQRVFSQVDKIQVDGLSRVYRINLTTPDLTRLDVNALLPLWSGVLSAEQAQALVKLAVDKNHFWRTNGMTMVSAADSNFDPSCAKGAGGIWLYWLTLIGEGLLEAGEGKKVSELLRNVLTLLTEILKKDRSFFQFYHSDEPTGSGETHHLGGIFPLYLFSRAIGIQIVSPVKVWTGGSFAWGQTVTVTQHGVVVKRSAKKINIRFPSGHKVDLPGDAPWQTVMDAKATAPAAFTPPPLPDWPDSPAKPAPESRERVIIKVEREQ